MVDVEIVKEGMDFDDGAEVIKIEHVKVPVQQIIVNNEIQQVMANVYALICPKCGAIIKQFPPEFTVNDVIAAATTDKPEMLDIAIHCAKCGKKLKLYRPLPVEGKFEILN